MMTSPIGSRLPHLVGGALCLDFANTCEGRGGPTPVEFVHDYADLVAWGWHAGAVDDRVAIRLTTSLTEPAGKAAAHHRALDLRETLYRIFAAVARGEPPPSSDLATLSRASADAMTHAVLVATQHGVIWSWRDEDGAFDRVLWPVIRSATDLLTAGNLDRLKECPGGGDGPCTWLFLDTTKNGIRQWCSMADCGGRAKARRQTAKRRHARQSV